MRAHSLFLERSAQRPRDDGQPWRQANDAPPCPRPSPTPSPLSLSLSSRVVADWDAVVKLSEGFNGADMRNVCTEAGMFAIRDDRDYVVEDDFMKAARKTAETKKLETQIEYSKV